MFEGFVKASVVAIEAKDPVTHGHSERVANLTVAMAKTINNTLTPFFTIKITPLFYKYCLLSFSNIASNLSTSSSSAS